MRYPAVTPGARFGMLTVLEFAGKGPRGDSRWLCRCDCGSSPRIIYQSNLRRAHGCGCAKFSFKPISIGDRFGRLTVIADGGRDQKSRQLWVCQCDCGSEPRPIFQVSLNSGKTVGCGCVRAERAAQANTKHGRTRTPEYLIWGSMVQRCTNPKNKRFSDYGGRGITVCERWRSSFENFLADMGTRPEGHSIERRNNDRGYEPDNCYWAPARDQSRNRRDTVLVTIRGTSQPFTDALKSIGVSKGAAYARMGRTGETHQQAINHYSNRKAF